jgi:sugar phosphate isomerase/epimerase
MKLAFSTLGCPRWSLDTIIRAAGVYGFQGIEVRGLQDDLDVTNRSEFTGQASLFRRQLQDHGVEIACFSSSVALSGPDAASSDTSFDELKRYTQLCVTFGTPFIRIFGGRIGSVSRAIALDTAAANLLKMADVVRDTRVKILVETHDDWMRADHLKSLMAAVSSEAIGLLWDVNHPFMFLGEAPATTWEQTGPWIHHTHWKDSKRNPRARHGFEPCLMGDGLVPHQEIDQVLKNGNYDGYLSLEWEKRWHPEIAEPEVAFPQFVEYMRGFHMAADIRTNERCT